jgi:hypothetical protein
MPIIISARVMGAIDPASSVQVPRMALNARTIALAAPLPNFGELPALTGQQII